MLLPPLLRWISAGAMGQFIVEAANGEISKYLQNLRNDKNLFILDKNGDV